MELVIGTFVVLMVMILHPHAGYAQVPGVPAIGTGQMPDQMTLWQTLKAGGGVMVVIGLLSIAALAIVLYDIRILTVNRLAPRGLYDAVMNKIEMKDFGAAKSICRSQNSNIISKIVLAGLDRKNPTDEAAREAMESCARIELTGLWQNISYLTDIVAVAPLLGLLGTVLGMIQAFHAVPLQSASLKTTLLAAGISKAMVTTASGLVVAIPALIAYSYFRGQVQQITNVVEIYCTDIVKAIQKR